MPAPPPDGRHVIFAPEPFPQRVVDTLDALFKVRQGRAGPAYSEITMATPMHC